MITTRFSFAPSWRMTGLAVLGIALFMGLGFWQIHRGQEKRQWLAAYQQATQRSPVAFPNAILPDQYQRIQVEGHYLPMTFLLDNQHHDHRFGYDVVSLLQLNKGGIVLVDRGWVAGDPARLTLPRTVTPVGDVHVIGHAYYPSVKGFLLGAELEVKHKDVVVIEIVNPAMLSQFLHKSLYPFMIRQSVDSPDGYVRDWAVVACSPKRHDAYAMQWFMFALIVAILFIALHLKTKK